MRIIELDATRWRTALDLYDDLLPALGSPEWHGRNINALIDSMIWGGINAVEPPYVVVALNAANLSKDAREEIELLRAALIEAREEFHRRNGHDVEVELKIQPGSPPTDD